MLVIATAAMAFADTLYLTDGSILIGSITKLTERECRIKTDVLGEVGVPREKILYKDADAPDTKTETFVLSQDGATLLSLIHRPVPAPGGKTGAFRLLIPGSVQSVSDENGHGVPFDKQNVSGNTLITIHYGALSPSAIRLTLTTLQPDLIKNDSGGLTFQQKYLLDRKQTLKVILQYPSEFKVRSITPEPKVRRDGLIVWEQLLKRQQEFSPRVVLRP